METTIDLDDELLRTAQALSEARGQSLSSVISELAWRGLERSPAAATTRNGFPVLAVPAGARPVTPEHISQLLDQSDIQDLYGEDKS